MSDEPKVWQCGLTRYAMDAGNYLVNSSQRWILKIHVGNGGLIWNNY